MRHEFEYFYEPNDEEQPIRKLTIECDVDVTSDPHPAFPNQECHTLRLKSYRVYASSGVDVTNLTAFIGPKIVAAFYENEQQKVLDILRNEGL